MLAVADAWVWVLVADVAEVGFPHFLLLSIAVAAGRVVSCNL